MLALRGTRVFVLDDDHLEAIPIIQAFAQRGVSTAYFDATMGCLPSPKKRLRGVRLAVLDMDLGEGGANERTMASAVVKRLEKIIDPNNGPYAALLWTNRPTVRTEFEDFIYTADVPKPVATVIITKAEVKDRRGKFKIGAVAKRVEAELAKVGPLLPLQSWEQACFRAAAGVTAALSDMVTSTAPDLAHWRDDWKRQILELMHSLAEAKAEQRLENRNCVGSLYSSFNPLHSDRLGREIRTSGQNDTGFAADIMGAALATNVAQKAKINSMMHLDFQAPASLDAGNVYIFNTVRKAAWVPEPNDILRGFVHGNADEMINDAIPVLMEVSAKCDHAQRKIQMGRLLGGVLVLADQRRRFLNRRAVDREGASLWELGPVSLEPAKLVGEFYLQFNSRSVATLPIKQVQKMKATCKLRSQALAHIQAWYAFQGSRPGMVLLKDR